jgi:hypothetical protein
MADALPLETLAQAPGLPEIDPVFGVAGAATGAFVSTLVIGGIMVALAPDYTERTMERVRADAVGSFVYGVLALLVVVVVTVALAITLIGVLLAIPFALLASLLWAVGAAIAYLAIGDALVGGDGWLGPLLVGAGINGAVTLTGIGGIVSFCVGAAGFGAVLRGWL